MPESAIDDLVRNHEQRHNHWQNQTDRCPYCGSFVTLNKVGTTRKGVCKSCGKAILQYAEWATA